MNNNKCAYMQTWLCADIVNKRYPTEQVWLHDTLHKIYLYLILNIKNYTIRTFWEVASMAVTWRLVACLRSYCRMLNVGEHLSWWFGHVWRSRFLNLVSVTFGVLFPYASIIFGEFYFGESKEPRETRVIKFWRKLSILQYILLDNLVLDLTMEGKSCPAIYLFITPITDIWWLSQMSSMVQCTTLIVCSSGQGHLLLHSLSSLQR